MWTSTKIRCKKIINIATTSNDKDVGETEFLKQKASIPRVLHKNLKVLKIRSVLHSSSLLSITLILKEL